MVTRGKIRSNGYQLANYLLRKADNDNVFVLDIVGTTHRDDVRKSLLEMSVTSELTRSNAGLYHAQICPAYEDLAMSHEDWIRAAEIMEEELGFTGQKRAIVLHDKKGKTHAHIVWERYDHQTGLMKSNKHSRLAQDRARVRMETEFEQIRTPSRNKDRHAMKAELTALWRKAQNGKEFVTLVEKHGYMIGTGLQRSFMIVDKKARSFDLIRQLDGVKTKAVRERLSGIKFITEKKAVETNRNKRKDRLYEQSKEVETSKTLTVDTRSQKPDQSNQLSFAEVKSNENPEVEKADQMREQERKADKKKKELKEELLAARMERARRSRERGR